MFGRVLYFTCLFLMSSRDAFTSDKRVSPLPGELLKDTAETFLVLATLFHWICLLAVLFVPMAQMSQKQCGRESHIKDTPTRRMWEQDITYLRGVRVLFWRHFLFSKNRLFSLRSENNISPRMTTFFSRTTQFTQLMSSYYSKSIYQTDFKLDFSSAFEKSWHSIRDIRT